MNKAEFAALCLAAAMAMTRPDHADFKRALKNAAAERSGWGWAGGMLASAASFLADRVGMFRHRDCLLFSVEHADVAIEKWFLSVGPFNMPKVCGVNSSLKLLYV